VFSPGYPTRLKVGAGYRGQSFTIERGALEAQLRILTGREPREPVSFDPLLHLDRGANGALHAILQLFRREVRRPDSSPLWLTTLRDAVLTSLLVNTRNSASEILHAPAPRVAPGSVRRAEELIEAHAGEALSLADIVAAAGVPARSLRAAFAASRGIGPMEYLRQCRLDLGRRRLLEADEGTTVASVVSALGLGAAGRFSVEYRRRFGESPSETLAAGRGGGVSRRTLVPAAPGSGRNHR
jgi:AraC-like DNA-binding protein